MVLAHVTEWEPYDPYDLANGFPGWMCLLYIQTLHKIS